MFCLMRVTVVLHELGHLLCGLLRGEKLFYFSIGPLHIVRRPEGRLGWGWYRTPGAAGTCLTYPENGQGPHALSILGGALANLLTGLVFLLLALRMRPTVFYGIVLSSPVWHILLLMLAVESLVQVLPNLIPIQTLTAGNDGYLLRLLRKNEDARADYRQMTKVVAALQQETGLRDMPEEWFPKLPPERLNNAYAHTVAIDGATRLLVRGEYTEALAECRRLLEGGVTFSPLLQLKLVMTGMICELLLHQPGECTERFQQKDMQRLSRVFAHRLDVHAARYAFAELYRQDRLAADDLRASFDRAACRHPFPADVAAERQIMDTIREAADEGNGFSPTIPVEQVQ